MIFIKTITKREMDILFTNGILRNTNEGIIGKDGWPAGYTTTCNKAYIQDKYVDMARELIQKMAV